MKFVFILKRVNSLYRYHNQYLLKLLTVSFCFLIFVVYLVIVKFIIYSILACNFAIDNWHFYYWQLTILIDNCTVFSFLFRNKNVDLTLFNYKTDLFKVSKKTSKYSSRLFFWLLKLPYVILPSLCMAYFSIWNVSSLGS